MHETTNFTAHSRLRCGGIVHVDEVVTSHIQAIRLPATQYRDNRETGLGHSDIEQLPLQAIERWRVSDRNSAFFALSFVLFPKTAV